MDQLVKFNAAMADHSSEENPHLIDGIVLTKFDTIDDKVSAISSFAAFELKNIALANVDTRYGYLDTAILTELSFVALMLLEIS